MTMIKTLTPEEEGDTWRERCEEDDEMPRPHEPTPRHHRPSPPRPPRPRPPPHPPRPGPPPRPRSRNPLKQVQKSHHVMKLEASIPRQCRCDSLRDRGEPALRTVSTLQQNSLPRHYRSDCRRD